MRLLRGLLASLLSCAIVLAGCASQQSFPPPAGSEPVDTMVGPMPSSSFGVKSELAADADVAITRLDVIVPVFDPGLSDEAVDYEEENIWPELRRAEANRFAYKLKLALEDTGAFGAVRVTPDDSATGDLYVKGTILESNGEDVAIRVDVVDISGRIWFARSFDHEVDEGFHKNPRNQGRDPYDPVFEEAAEDVAEELQDLSPADLEQLALVTELRFGASLAEEAFKEHIQLAKGRVSARSFPSEEDPMLRRMRAIRVRDQLFVDGLQANYESFSQEMNESYLIWQQQSLFEIQAERAAERAWIGEAIGGVALIALAILGGFVGVNAGQAGGLILGGSAVAGVAGASLLKNSFSTSEEARVHRDALQELGESINIDLSPRVVAFEEQTVELTGDAKAQFAQWRSFLQQIYEQEQALGDEPLSPEDEDRALEEDDLTLTERLTQTLGPQQRTVEVQQDELLPQN